MSLEPDRRSSAACHLRPGTLDGARGRQIVNAGSYAAVNGITHRTSQKTTVEGMQNDLALRASCCYPTSPGWNAE